MTTPDSVIKKKICLLGAFATGKTSLVRRFVHSVFSEKYHTSVGVKVDQKVVDAHGRPVCLLLWDLAGLDEFQEIQPRYLRGSAGFIVVVDGTRRDTLDQGLAIHDRALETVPDARTVIALNKTDLEDEWDVNGSTPPHPLLQSVTPMFKTSAKTGEGVEELFLKLTQEMVVQD